MEEVYDITSLQQLFPIPKQQWGWSANFCNKLEMKIEEISRWTWVLLKRARIHLRCRATQQALGRAAWARWQARWPPLGWRLRSRRHPQHEGKQRSRRFTLPPLFAPDLADYERDPFLCIWCTWRLNYLQCSTSGSIYMNYFLAHAFLHQLLS